MPRLLHGATLTLEEIRGSRQRLAAQLIASQTAYVMPGLIATTDYDFLFPELQDDDANLLEESRATRDALLGLGQMMPDPTNPDPGDSGIPAAYTYFGQFVDHDITLESKSATLPELLDQNLTPLSRAEIASKLRNGRTGSLDLDSVYSLKAPMIGDLMELGTVASLGSASSQFSRPPLKDNFNDLPREPRCNALEMDRAARIGDERNDENLVTSQLHVAFLRAHNALVAAGADFDQAMLLLRQHYQAIVLTDFLPRVADPDIVADTIASGGRIFDWLATPYCVPLEFTVAAYRFGHSMVRPSYDYNVNFTSTPGKAALTLEQLFTFTALSGSFGPGLGAPPDGFDTLPEHLIIEWEHFVDVGQPFNCTRKIDTGLERELFRLRDLDGSILSDGTTSTEAMLRAHLAVRNLLRGYLLRLPTGQAVACALQKRLAGVREIPILSETDILNVALNKGQRNALKQGKFTTRTPLWFYILAEAAHCAGGNHLGPVGSTIVAEVLVGLVRRSACSILRAPGWCPTLPRAESERFTLTDLLRVAGVLAPAAVPAGRRRRTRQPRPANREASAR